MGSGAAPVGWPVGATGKARLPRPFIMRPYGGRLWQACGVSGSTRKEEKLPSPAARLGEGERGTVSFKTTLFCTFFFFNMKRRRFMKNAPFHLKVAPASFFELVLNLSFVLLSPHNVILILRINSIASLKISVSAPISWPRFPL